MKHYSMRLFFDDDVPLLSTSLIQFEMCIKEMFPDLFNHLVRLIHALLVFLSVLCIYN
jgi:hypothetical protein